MRPRPVFDDRCNFIQRMAVDNGCKLRSRPAVDDRATSRSTRSRAAIDWSPFHLLNNKTKKGTDVSNEQGNIISKHFFFDKTQIFFQLVIKGTV